jgi:hypothetical protein
MEWDSAETIAETIGHVFETTAIVIGGLCCGEARRNFFGRTPLPQQVKRAKQSIAGGDIAPCPRPTYIAEKRPCLCFWTMGRIATAERRPIGPFWVDQSHWARPAWGN